MKNYLRKFVMGDVLTLVAILLLSTLIYGWFSSSFVDEREQPAERAGFMLECVYDWGLSAPECRAMLRGADPPPLDAESGC